MSLSNLNLSTILLYSVNLADREDVNQSWSGHADGSLACRLRSAVSSSLCDRPILDCMLRLVLDSSHFSFNFAAKGKSQDLKSVYRSSIRHRLKCLISIAALSEPSLSVSNSGWKIYFEHDSHSRNHTNKPLAGAVMTHNIRNSSLNTAN